MFRAIARLLFGGEEQTPEDFKSGEMAAEEWQVVSHQEADSAENQGPEQTPVEQSGSAHPQDTLANKGALNVISVVDPEPTGQSSSAHPAVAGAAPQLKPLTVVEQLTLVQKARTWADRHHVTRNTLQRHNRVRLGVQQSLFHLQQPARRSLAH
ncbi:hypothetical protein fugu_004664 [Takifugu bimaculatus]|uniref:Uncharacterized protein n=1 Tax=Takifugu bimaculatus TaxID=433685 RepID=A0A4Z2BBG7_9TELE|nr:hypothetical protein fugu_004664 [Takifugu bimaculatus]